MVEDNVPHDVERDAEIVVHDTVPHAGDVFPRNVRMRPPGLGRELLHRLAHDLEVADDGVLRADVAPEARLPVRRVEEDPLDRLQDVPEIESVILQSATASARTRCRM